MSFLGLEALSLGGLALNVVSGFCNDKVKHQINHWLKYQNHDVPRCLREAWQLTLKDVTNDAIAAHRSMLSSGAIDTIGEVVAALTTKPACERLFPADLTLVNRVLLGMPGHDDPALVAEASGNLVKAFIADYAVTAPTAPPLPEPFLDHLRANIFRPFSRYFIEAAFKHDEVAHAEIQLQLTRWHSRLLIDIKGDTGHTRTKVDEIHEVIVGGKPANRVVPLATSNLAAANIAPNQFFTGRGDELSRLHAALAGGSVAIVHALTGEGGIGKTELAREYARRHAKDYDSAWWIDASAAALRGELMKVYEKVVGAKPPDNAQTADLCQALVDRWAGRRPLIILDNVDEPGAFTLFAALPAARVLATTRQHHKTLQGVEWFPLGVLPIPDAVALMRKEIAKHRADVTDADLTAIAEELDGHALAVALAGAYLANYPSYSATEVLAKLRASKVGDVDPVADDAEHDALGLSYRRSVAASLSLSFAIPQVAAALPVLAAASFLHPAGITIEWLMAGTGWDKDEVIKAARTLSTYSIIKYDKAISLHRLTQGVARARAGGAGDAKGTQTLSRLLDALIELFRWPGTVQEELVDHTKTPARLAAVAHAEAVIGHAEAGGRAGGEGAAAPLPRTPTPAEAEVAGERGAKAARLRSEMARQLIEAGQLADAARHIDAALAWFEAQSPRDERGLAIRYASRASIRQQRGDLKGAEEDIHKAIAWGEDQSPRDERGLAILYASRASIRQLRGDLAGAEEDIQKSIDWGEAQSPRDERSLAIRYASRASIRQDKGDLKGAEEDIQKSIDWFEAQTPRDERGLAIRYASRASIRKDRGDLAGAEEDIQKSIDWGEAQTPRDERSLAIRYASRASIRQDKGDLKGAEEDIKKAIDWGEDQSPRDERGLAIDYASRASIRQQRGDLAGAEADIQKSIDWGEDQSPRDERGLAILYASRASIRQDRGDLKGAEEDIQKAIDWEESQSPPNQRGLAILYASRASIRKDRGDLKGAEEDIKKAIDWGEAQSPRDERGLAIRYASRASIRQDKGDLKGAEEDIKKAIDWGEDQSPRDERGLAIDYASRASIRKDRGDLKGAEADLQKSIDWFEAQTPRDERGLAIWYASRASIRKHRGDLKGAEADIQKSIDWGEDQTPRDERGLAIDYASRARIRRDLKQYALAHADIDAALAWWLANLPGDERTLTIFREIKASIHAAQKR